VFERAVAAAATATELAAWTILETPFALLAHGVITVALGAHLWRVWAGNQLGFALPLTVATAVAGPIGAGSMLAAMLLTEFFRRSAKPAADWLDGLDEARGSGTRTNPSRDREGAVSAVEVTPLMDILEMGDELQKQEVVALVTRSFRPALAPLLKRALEDSSNAIRVQAATAMARIEGRFLHRAMQLDQLAAKKPGSSDVARDLAHLYDDYAFTGLLDPVRERENLQLARQWYETWIALEPNRAEAHFALGRLLIRCEEWEQADYHLEKAGGDASVWRLETLFRLGRYEEIPALAASLNCEDPLMPLSLRQAAQLWTTEEVRG
jgi:hypothetical protein